MSSKYLGQIFDIHAGGIDLVFPHHENEIAQSRCAFHTPVMANFWLHNGFLQVEGEKMSKSLGNFVTIRHLLRGWKGTAWSGAAVRLTMLRSHYRQPIDWAAKNLAESRDEIAHFAHACQFSTNLHFDDIWANEPVPTEDLLQALSKDLNTPEAIAVLRDRYRRLGTDNLSDRLAFLANVRFLGLFTDKRKLFNFPLLVTFTHEGNLPVALARKVSDILSDLNTNFANDDVEMISANTKRLQELGFEVRRGPEGIVSLEPGMSGPAVSSDSQSIQSLIDARNAARKAKDFKESDRIRDELAAQGIVLKDSKDGTTWEVKR
jgi:cysteinyl-tRNA synthetase